MSRRENRDSDPKRERSRFDRESSPKRSRRDEAEGVLSKKHFDVRNGTETDQKPRRDASPLEPDAQALRKDDENKLSGHHEMTKSPSKLPICQKDFVLDHTISMMIVVILGKMTEDQLLRGSWRGPRDQSNRRAGDDENPQHRKDEDKSTWRHDKFHESDDANGALPRKRPAFREKKIPEESRNDTGRTRTEEAKDTSLNSRRQNERNWRSNLQLERHERASTGRDRMWNRNDERVAGSRQSYRTHRDGFNRNGFHGSWTRAEKKWDHDLYEEANKRANEEEQIAKVEALLAS